MPCLFHKTTTIQRDQEIELSSHGASLRIFDSIEAAKTDWITAQPADNLFLQPAYLQFLEDHPPLDTEFAYLVFYDHGRPGGVAYCQLLHFRAERSLRMDNAGFFKTFVAGKANFDVILCGNALLTGAHGYHFYSANWLNGTPLQLLNEGMDHLQENLLAKGRKMNGVFIKDPFPSSKMGSVFTDSGFHEFQFLPNMVMGIDPSWNSFEDYMASLQSKYRVRAKRAFKKAKGIQKMPLDMNAVASFSDQLDALFLQVVAKADFNLVEVPAGYFETLKAALGDKMQVTGYFENGELTGFYTTIQNGLELEAHFLGMDLEKNRSQQLYLNMLFDIIREGIEMGASKIVFARTAMEIKSSVGATAIEMSSFIRHRNGFSNRFISQLMGFLSPSENWQPRHPFKQLD